MMRFSNIALERSYSLQFSRARFKYDIAASAFSAFASLSFCMKATYNPSLHLDVMTRLSLYLMVTSKTLPLCVAMIKGQDFYLTHRTFIAAVVTLGRAVPYALMLLINKHPWSCDLVKGLLGEAMGGSLASPLSYQLPFNWHMLLHGMACCIVSAALAGPRGLCARVQGTLCGPSMDHSSRESMVCDWEACTDLQRGFAHVAKRVNDAVNVFVLPFVEGSHGPLVRPCHAVTLLVLFNIGFVLPTAVLYYMESTGRKHFAAQHGYRQDARDSMLSVWLFDPLPIIGSLIYASCGLWLYVRVSHT